MSGISIGFVSGSEEFRAGPVKEGSKQYGIGFNERKLRGHFDRENQFEQGQTIGEVDCTTSSGRGRVAGKTYKEAVESEYGLERTVTENFTSIGKSNWSWVVICERQVLN
ncbi:unnamed protein product [Prunus armeniaca]|uniref:Uncharacterized protein n=1 Tax=Prunus armeniaca TaxID=36596 RepID=A0A6J5UVK4_PRUAR|nr:unnamed protein product [Prunus armeniaca]